MKCEKLTTHSGEVKNGGAVPPLPCLHDVVKVKISLLQAMEAHRVARG
jgi:hypothetical protein